jgi:ABC-type transport system involved in multi-copper enzyme maturation permease subunit
MLPGPVFNFELMATARRSRFYLVRAFYAAILFIILWAVHAGWTAETGGELDSHQVSWFALSAFCAITVGQEILVLLLTPALVAGAIADEKQRKTLHYLMASRLSSAEIVLGKLLVRMLYVTVLLGVSLPVLSLLVLMGGVDPRLVLLSCGATLSTGWFLAALSIWVSTIARRVREAFFVAFGLECLWLFSPLILKTISIPAWPMFDQCARWLYEWVGASSPIEVAIQLFFSTVMTRGMGTKSEVEVVAWMMGLQLAFGLILALVASCQLRPIFRRQGSEGGVRAIRQFSFRRRRRIHQGTAGVVEISLAREPQPRPSTRRRWRLRRRPALGDRPMLWKELYTGGPRGFTRFIGFVLTVIGGGFLFYYAVWLGSLAIGEMRDFGATSQTDWYTWGNRAAFQSFLRGVIPLVYMIGILGVAGAAAASMTSEHEDDTWVSLTATDLTGREIIFAKMFGAMRRSLKFGEMIVLLALAGAVAGSISPLSIPLLLVGMVVYAFAAAALGIWISIQLRSTWRSQFLTMACLLLINVFGQGLLNMLSRFGYAPQLWPGFTPYEISKLLLDKHFIDRLAESKWPSSWWVSSMDDGLVWQTIFSVGSVLAYVTLAALLVWHTLHRFEIVAGRAQRASLPPPSSLKLPDPKTGTPATAQPEVAGARA